MHPHGIEDETGIPTVQLDRISYQYPDGTTAGYDLHPRLTVIDVHPAHRSALVEHLLRALWSEAPGVHVELRRSDGSAVVAFRPYGARHRAIDIDHSRDVTADYTRNGHVDLLTPVGVTPERAHDVLLADRSDLILAGPTVTWLSTLSGCDVDELLAAADECTRAESELREATESAPPAPIMSAARIEAYARRDAASALESRHNRIRVATLVAGTAGPIAAVLLLDRIGAGPALALIGASVLLALTCILFERKLARAVDAEYAALAAVGADSYDELESPSDAPGASETAARSRLVDASERFDRATQRWRALAGDIPAPWAVSQGSRLRELSQLLAPRESGLRTPVAAPGGPGSILLAGLLERIHSVGDLGGGEPLPLFLDDPVAGLAPVDKATALDALGRLAARQQLVVCTDDQDVLDWAAREVLDGRALVIDANPGRKLMATERTPST